MKLSKNFKALTTAANPAQWLIDAFNGGSKSKAGVNVNTGSVLGLSPVMYAVNKIGGHIAGMKINIKRSNKDGSVEIVDNNVSRLLNTSPNSVMTAYTLRECMMTHMLLAGNGRAYINRNSNGTPVELIPIQPQNCQTAYINGSKWHLVTPTEFTEGLPQRGKNKDGLLQIPDRDVIHVMNQSYNGIWGLNIVQVCKDVFGLTQAGQTGAANVIANSGRPGMLLEAPNGMFRSAEDAKEFLDNFNEAQAGLSNTGKAAILKDGMTANIMPISAADSQFLAQREFQRSEIAMLFGLEAYPGDNSGQTYKSITERNTAYINNTLSRFIMKWQQEIDAKLLSYGRLSSSFDTSSLQYGDPNSLAQYTDTMARAGVMTVNELRAANDLGNIEGGDELTNTAPTSEPNQPEPTDTESNEDNQ